LNEAKDQYFENATVTIEKKIIEKTKQDRMGRDSYDILGKVMFRFTISDLGTFEIIAKGDDRGTSEIDIRSPKFIPGAASGGGFKKIATLENQSGKLYLSAKRSRNKQVFFQTRDILFYTDESDEYYPGVYLHLGTNKKYDFYGLYNL